MKINRCTKRILLPALLLANISVSSAFAQPTWKTLSLKGVVDLGIQALANVLIPLAVAILFFVFIYGIALYMRAASKGDNNLADLAKKRLLYGILTLFAVFSLWGFVYLLRNLFTGDFTGDDNKIGNPQQDAASSSPTQPRPLKKDEIPVDIDTSPVDIDPFTRPDSRVRSPLDS